MTENELTSLQKNLQQLLNKHNYADLFEELVKYPFLKGYMTFYNEFTVGTYKTDAHFAQRFVAFVNNAFREEREKLNVLLDETILRKEQTIQELERTLASLQQQIREAEGKLASLPAQIGKEKSKLETLQQQIREAEGKLASLPAQASPAQETEARMWFEKEKALPTDSDKILAYNKAIACKPDFAEAYYKRGMTNNQIYKHKEAVADFSKAIEYKPDFAEAYFERGCTKSLRLSQDQESLADYTQVIFLNPKHKLAYFYRGLAKKALEMYQEAIVDYKQYLQFDKIDYTSLYRIAECYAMLQDKQNTLRYLAEAIQSYSSYKEESKKNKVFEWLWEDADFKRLVG